jgi:hypothetical protein
MAQESASSELFLRRVKMRTVLNVYLSALNNHWQFIAASLRMQVFHPQNGGKERYA